MNLKINKFSNTIIAILIITNTYAAIGLDKKEEVMKNTNTQTQLQKQTQMQNNLILDIPEKFNKKIKKVKVKIDSQNADLIRYERSDGVNTGLMGEHFSMLISENGNLSGFTLMDAALAQGNLPSKTEAEEIALRFLNEHAPDLLESFKISWIDKHNEQIQLKDNKKTVDLTITGMKVKMQNTKDKKWFWVIIGTNKKVFVFERDIIWISFPGHRKTEKWLHDSWLVKNNFADLSI
ncbi:hypothetical protein [Fluviispira vulneris]|uniref:hypothetical protein n=1 Tax=Fluviispira vulneris TaxID=2763012 RepID=UPI0016492327|nr:hypothetical protein [Fluviispira vulneris]